MLAILQKNKRNNLRRLNLNTERILHLKSVTLNLIQKRVSMGLELKKQINNQKIKCFLFFRLMKFLIIFHKFSCMVSKNFNKKLNLNNLFILMPLCRKLSPLLKIAAFKIYKLRFCPTKKCNSYAWISKFAQNYSRLSRRLDRKYWSKFTKVQKDKTRL